MIEVIKNILIISILFIFAFLYFWKISFNLGGEVKLGLRLFKQVYRINQKKWEYCKADWIDDLCRNLYYEGYQIKLSFPAFLWFLFYKITSSHRENKTKERELLIFILEDCQEDINKLKKKAEEDIKKALKQQEKILKGWERHGLDN